MRKKITLVLVSILSIIICAFSFTACTGNFGNQDVASANFVSGTTPFETLQTFVTTYQDRVSIQNGVTDPAKDAGLWIAEQLNSFGYTSSMNVGTTNYGLDTFTYDNLVTKKKELAHNVVFKKESPSNKTVVIGAHYDNVYNLLLNDKVVNSDGTYNNGVGIATLIETARALKDVNLPFDVEFVAFGAEEFGWYGSERYLNNRTDKDNILLMINFDRNAIGDYVYMYSSEAQTKHNKFFYDVARENNLCIADLPSYRQPAMFAVPSNSYFSNEANWADSDMFLAEGINIVNFISMNFKPFEVVESDGKDNIAYTDNDTFLSVVERLGGLESAKQTIDKQINSAVSAVVYSLEKENFVEVMTSSKANGGLDTLLNSKIISYINYGILGGAIIALIVLYFVLKQSAKTHDVFINTAYGRVNTRTGKLEGNVTQGRGARDNVGSVFGEEFDSNSKNFDDISASNSSNQNSQSNDKSKDIFGDF